MNELMIVQLTLFVHMVSMLLVLRGVGANLGNWYGI